MPSGWLEHRRENDVIYAPPGIDYRAKALSHGVRVFVVEGDTTNVPSQLERLMQSYAKANPQMRVDGSYLVEPGLGRASVTYSNVPADDPASREAGWVLVARLTKGRVVCLLAVWPEAEKARSGATFSYIRESVRVPGQ